MKNQNENQEVDGKTSLPISITDLTKTYGKVFALNSVSIEVEAGEFLTLLGPSGSGKTTLLMAIAGFNRPDSGSIVFGKKEMILMPPHKRDVGMVFQNYALFPHMTVYENLSFPLEVRKLTKTVSEEKIKRALDMVQMREFGNRRPAQLSGGQQQRIALARSLVFEPDLVLMDEPLGALDKQLREHMQYEIKHLHERLGVTVVYVTHDQSEALTMSDRVAVFNDGVIQQLASPPDLYEQPENAFVAQFIGENNKIMAEVVDVKGSVVTAKTSKGNLLKSKKVNCDKIGSKTTLSIRPERIKVGTKGENTSEAKILELIYIGDHIRCRMLVEGDENFIVKIPNAKSISNLKIGLKTKVSWSTSDCRALDRLVQ